MQQYEPASKKSAAITKGLITVWEKLGKPTDTSTNTGWVVMDNIMQVWMKFYPWELKDWIEKWKEELGAERSVHEALKANGGYFPISYPTRLVKLVKTLLPQADMKDRDFIKAMISRYPFLKSTNYKL